MIDIPDGYKLKSYQESEEASYYEIEFDLSFPAEQIRKMSDQFRIIRRQASGPGWGKHALGWEYFHQPLLDEQFKLRIDTLANRLQYSYFMAY